MRERLEGELNLDRALAVRSSGKGCSGILDPIAVGDQRHHVDLFRHHQIDGKANLTQLQHADLDDRTTRTGKARTCGQRGSGAGGFESDVKESLVGLEWLERIVVLTELEDPIAADGLGDGQRFRCDTENCDFRRSSLLRRECDQQA